MSPAEELRAAADRLDDLHTKAAMGPWLVKDEIDGMRAGRMTVVHAAGRRIVSVGQTRPHHDATAEHNVALIAAMRLVVEPLAASLRQTAELHQWFSAPTGGDDFYTACRRCSYEPGGAEDDDDPCPDMAAALVIARAINDGAS